uniref:Serine aminopeptidase S33 domain-containing protein n=1 Tax=Ditylum brightwellii TaxID=49249 RepID=A0A7S2A0G5_9STRA|mmetsp:Transcript_5627/g.8540  ORF Transcript_5627/g.8540 Transcript_5627/m.8540 type:complete len:350 (+) Transcript_5627:226-1275(+)
MMPKLSLISGTLAVLLAALLGNAPGVPEWKYDLPNIVEEEKGETIQFTGGDGTTTLTGRLYHPAGRKQQTPVIVLAHGLGLSQDCSLDIFVNAFNDAGFATFTFDYTTFGASEGFPRHVINPSGQIADLHAAIDVIEKTDSLQVDTSKIGLWGTSYGGGHVLVAAASQNPSIRAVVSQVPALGSGAESVLATLMRTPHMTTVALAKTLLASMKWALLGIVGKTWYVPLHGLLGSAAMMQNEGDNEGYAALLPPGGGKYGHRNAASVGSVFRVLVHRPINSVASVVAPSLLIAAEHDTLCPVEQVVKAAEIIEGAELLVLPGLGHFDVYSGDALKEILSSTTKFLKKHLK